MTWHVEDVQAAVVKVVMSLVATDLEIVGEGRHDDITVLEVGFEEI